MSNLKHLLFTTGAGVLFSIAAFSQAPYTANDLVVFEQTTVALKDWESTSQHVPDAEAESDQVFTVFSDPTDQDVVVKSNFSVLSAKIYDLNGELVTKPRKRKAQKATNGDLYYISLKNVPEGLYILELELADGSHLRKYHRVKACLI